MDGTRWVRRYLDGDRGEVWQQLRRLGGRVRDPEYLEAAQAVCDEAARRARHNVELIVERLRVQGFAFHENDDGRTPTVAFAPPTPAAVEHVAWLESTIGPVPLILSSWIRLVGDVWLVGTHPTWPTSSAADPLVIDVEGARYPGTAFRAHILDDFTSWQDEGLPGPYQLPLAPDHFHKANVSGGPPYGLVLPDRTAEGWFVADGGSSFVAYLRSVFRRGGFPRPTGHPQQRAITSALARDLLPL